MRAGKLTVLGVVNLAPSKSLVLVQGPTAAGKTSVITDLAELTGTEFISTNDHEHTELTE